ncbi:MAG: hypothetical protein PHV06_03990 [bacterium]|nr:hypothetical protein [bacterium]
MKKEIIIPIYLFGISILFIIVSFLLFLSGGKNAKLLSKKLKLGALIISLTAALGCTPINPHVTSCYVPPMPYVEVENEVVDRSDTEWKYSIEIDLSKTNVITGKSMHSFGASISFRITDKNGNVIQFDDAVPVDGKFNDHSEKLECRLNKDIRPGEYTIVFYTREKILAEKSPDQHLYKTMTLIVK